MGPSTARTEVDVWLSSLDDGPRFFKEKALMQPDTKGPMRSAHLLKLARFKGMLYIVFYEWIHRLPVSDAAKMTYASLLSLKNARMKTRAKDMGAFVSRSQRSVRRHVRELETRGLIVRNSRYRKGRQIANEFDLLWHPAMPEQLKGESHDKPDLPRDVIGGREQSVESGEVAVSEVTAQFSSAEGIKKHAGKSAVSALPDLPPELESALETVAPGHYADCLRVLRETTAGLTPDKARAFSILALRRLIKRCESGAVTNPPGLLRARIVQEAMDANPTADGLRAQDEAELLRIDARLLAARSGHQAIRLMRERAEMLNALMTRHKEMLGAPPLEIPAACADDAGLSEPLQEIGRLLESVRAARDKGDALAEGRINEALLRLERKLDVLLTERGAKKP